MGGQGNKGEQKQQQWVFKLRQLLETADSLDPAVRNIINTIVDHDNIPRKRPKFVNFIKNIMRNKARDSDIERTWELFSQALAPPKPEPTPAPSPAPQAEEEAPPAKERKKEKKEKKKKKKEAEEEAPEPVPEPVTADPV